MRPRFDWKGHGLGKAVTLAKWTVLFVLANQAGAIVVTQLSTASGKASPVDGTGFAAYANAQLIWGLPQAIITVSLMAALLPRISRSAAEDDGGAGDRAGELAEAARDRHQQVLDARAHVERRRADEAVLVRVEPAGEAGEQRARRLHRLTRRR
jgi:hypothetical protein